MQKLIQTKLHNPPETKGNCFATCIACFLDIPISEVPTFEETMETDDWPTNAFNWLHQKGWEWYSLSDNKHKEGYYLAMGETSRLGNALHSCIYKNGELYHDPHPDQTGLTKIIHLNALNKIS